MSQDGCPTRNVLVASERSDDGGLIGKNDLVLGSGGEQTLKKSNGGVEDNGALHAGLHADLNLAIVDEVRANAFDIRGGLAVEVGVADFGTKVVRLDLVVERYSSDHFPTNIEFEVYLAKCGSLGVRARVSEWVLVVVVSVTIPGDNDDTENFRQQHCERIGVNQRKWWGKRRKVSVAVSLQPRISYKALQGTES